MILLVAVLSMIIVFMVIYIYYSERLVEKYSQALESLDYHDYLSAPTAIYERIQDPEPERSRKYFVEFHDKFFEDALKAVEIDPKEFHIDLENMHTSQGITNYSVYVASKDKLDLDIKPKVSQAIESALNKALPAEETNMFYVSSIQVRKVWKHVSGADVFVVHASSIMHRLGKAYGLQLVTTTYHAYEDVARLLNFTVKGFVFEDKVYGNVVPSNLETEDFLTYESLAKTKILMDPASERKILCSHLKDVQRFGSYASLSVENINCDG